MVVPPFPVDANTWQAAWQPVGMQPPAAPNFTSSFNGVMPQYNLVSSSSTINGVDMPGSYSGPMSFTLPDLTNPSSWMAMSGQPQAMPLSIQGPPPTAVPPSFQGPQYPSFDTSSYFNGFSPAYQPWQQSFGVNPSFNNFYSPVSYQQPRQFPGYGQFAGFQGIPQWPSFPGSLQYPSFQMPQNIWQPGALQGAYNNFQTGYNQFTQNLNQGLGNYVGQFNQGFQGYPGFQPIGYPALPQPELPPVPQFGDLPDLNSVFDDIYSHLNAGPTPVVSNPPAAPSNPWSFQTF